jgi:sacsin
MSDKVYNNEMKKTLVTDFTISARTLLLFSQNVESLKICQICENGSPNSMQEILSIRKAPLKLIRMIDAGFISRQKSLFQEQCNILKLASSVVKNTRKNSQKNISSIVIEITTKKDSDKEVKDHWIVTSCVGKSEALEMAKSAEGRRFGLMPCGAVAAKLILKGQENFFPQEISGEVFCFLPLSLPNRFHFNYILTNL